MTERKDKLQTLYYCNNRCVCCNETKSNQLKYKEIDDLRIILCKSCSEILRIGNIKKLIHRFGFNKKNTILNKKETVFREYLNIERLKFKIE